ncbi:hypothetical protein GN264_17210 [Escherichia coli]|nr:hypothetical protein [Escherichia coli]
MKITDKEILMAVWQATVKRLPYSATHHYVGDLRGLAGADDYWHRSATQICSVSRGYVLDLPLSVSQSLRRINALVDRKRLVISDRRPGEAFYFKLPDHLTRPAFDIARLVLRGKGMTETEFLPEQGYTEIAKEVCAAIEHEVGPLVEKYVRRCALPEEVTL